MQDPCGPEQEIFLAMGNPCLYKISKLLLAFNYYRPKCSNQLNYYNFVEIT
jgi:hypothetical protein